RERADACHTRGLATGVARPLTLESDGGAAQRPHQEPHHICKCRVTDVHGVRKRLSRRRRVVSMPACPVSQRQPPPVPVSTTTTREATAAPSSSSTDGR